MRVTRLIGLALVCVLLQSSSLGATAPNYDAARSFGRSAAERAAELLDCGLNEQKLIVLTNAGFARPGGLSSKGCLDGLSAATEASVGSSTLLRLQSRFDQPLWFAFYNPESGKCAYLQTEGEKAEKGLSGKRFRGGYFGLEQTARITAEYIVDHAGAFQDRAENGLFGDNLFRVVTAANAAAKNSPDDLLTAIQLHDHFCPGVSSGVLMARYIRERILSGHRGADCFILSLNPWCKEDALIALLNATPGKRGYGVVYPADGGTESWPAPLSRTDTVVFVGEDSEPWIGSMLRFDFAKAKEMFSGPESGMAAVDKLAMDLWLMGYLEKPEAFVDTVGTLQLKKGESPRDLLGAETNPVEMLSSRLGTTLRHSEAEQ
jgi:formylmethanofuran dehydrogenase subunit E-like metal-binding protein